MTKLYFILLLFAAVNAVFGILLLITIDVFRGLLLTLPLLVWFCLYQWHRSRAEASDQE